MSFKSIIKRKLLELLSLFSRIFKIQDNKIVVDNFLGQGFGDNPKYIVERLLQLDNSLDIVWLVNNEKFTFISSKIRPVKYYSFRSIYELATAHIWIDNVKNNFKGIKRKRQFYLQTWHGGIGFKMVEAAAESTLNEEYVRESKADSSQISLMISNSDWVTRNYQNNFWYSGAIAKTGLPRNDIFFRTNKNIIQKVKAFYHISQNTEIILYAPTFRAYASPKKQFRVCSFDSKKIIRAFEKKFNKKFVLIKRMHPNIASAISIRESKFVKDGSKYSDMQELLTASFALITDFSSCVFDFMLKSERIFLFANDYKEYIGRERKLLFNVEKDLPFTFAHNDSELASNITCFDQQTTKKKLDDFKNDVGLFEDGHASERVANILLEHIHSNCN